MDSGTFLEPMAEAQERLRKDGFTANFELDDEAVIDVDSGKRHRPEDVEIVSTHRNEGDTNPGDESVLFAVKAPDGVKGVISASYGPEAPNADATRRLGTAVRAAQAE